MNFCDAIKTAWSEDKAIRPVGKKGPTLFFGRWGGKVMLLDEFSNGIILYGEFMELEWEVVE